MSLLAAIPTEKCTYNEYMRAMLPLFHSLMFMTEEVQVNGLTFLVDFGGVNMGLITWMGLENMRLTADFINVRRFSFAYFRSFVC